MPIGHHCSFEESVSSWDRQLHLACFLKSILRRLETVAPEYHLILHTSPNVTAKFERKGHWQSLDEDFHWHFEIVPVLQMKAKSHSVKEVYYNSLPPELAAGELRKAGVEAEVAG
jgi:galactose-1-phosphate uridylyltransferase